MKPIKKYIACLLIGWFPAMAYASIGSDLNELFDSFFGSGQAPIDQSKEPALFPENTPTETPSLDIPEIVLPENPTLSDLTDLRSQIITEEASLDDFQQRIADQSVKLWEVGNQKNTLSNQLTQLDTQIGFNQQKIKKYQETAKKWKAILLDITRKKTIIKAEIRLRERVYNDFMRRQYIRAEHFGNDQSVPVIKWLFSRKTVAQILEEKQQNRQQAKQQRDIIENLQKAKDQLDKEEQQSAFLYGKTTQLQQKLAEEKLTLQALSEGRANLIQNLKKSEAEIQSKLYAYQQQRNESNIYLQNLHQSLKETQSKIQESPDDVANLTAKNEVKPPKNRFQWPLTKPIRITAYFRDSEYKKVMGRDHDGLDIASPQGSPVMAVASGTVKKIGANNYGYSFIVLEHANRFYSVYGHVSQILVQKGATITRGQIIAKSGGTPGTKGAGYFTTGPHLHFELFHNGAYLDPLKFLPKLK